MIQKKRSFENQLINLFWGLTRGSRLLTPYSDKFNKLGFKVVGFELSFYAYNRSQKATPDMILESINLKESIITEWTQSETVSEGKINQIRKYINIDDESLRMFVSETCVENRDVVLIIIPEAEKSYKQILESRNLSAILLVYHYPEDYLLEKKLNNFKVAETEDFFKQPLKFERIPYSFPDINLSDLSKSLLVDNVVSTLIEILVKEDEGFEFNIQYFIQRMLTKSFYNLLSANKRKNIAKVSKGIISDLLKQRYGADILKRVNLDPPTWRIVMSRAERLKRIKSIRRRFGEFSNKIAGRVYQLSLFGQIEPGGES